MYHMSFDIEVGEYVINMIDRVNIKRSVSTLSDTATITLPGTMENESLEVESKLKVQDKVIIKLGYDETLEPEFEGYLTNIVSENGTIRLECEDDLHQYRKAIQDKEFPTGEAGLKDILAYVNDQVGSTCSVDCDYDIQYEKFVIRGQTGYDVLKRIQDELMPNIYFKENTLHVHSMGSENYGEATYDFVKNIESDSLKYRKEEDRIVQVVINGGLDNKGVVLKGEAGKSGGDSITRKVSGMSEESLQKIAEEELSRRSYEGYEGSFKTWLIPFCDAGYKVTIVDEEYPEKEGSYYVTSVETDFSQSGGVRTISLGKKI